MQLINRADADVYILTIWGGAMHKWNNKEVNMVPKQLTYYQQMLNIAFMIAKKKKRDFVFAAKILLNLPPRHNLRYFLFYNPAIFISPSSLNEYEGKKTKAPTNNIAHICLIVLCGHILDIQLCFAIYFLFGHVNSFY